MKTLILSIITIAIISCGICANIYQKPILVGVTMLLILIFIIALSISCDKKDRKNQLNKHHKNTRHTINSF